MGSNKKTTDDIEQQSPFIASPSSDEDDNLTDDYALHNNNFVGGGRTNKTCFINRFFRRMTPLLSNYEVLIRNGSATIGSSVIKLSGILTFTHLYHFLINYVFI